jgi:hypothetical protein
MKAAAIPIAPKPAALRFSPFMRYLTSLNYYIGFDLALAKTGAKEAIWQ